MRTQNPEAGEPLDDRKATILRAIVSYYVTAGEPVGSKTLVEQYGLGVSSATVRNEMVALEELGYIHQPHTSAGRIPTDRGYRYFVNAYAAGAKLPSAETKQIQTFYDEARWELEDALRQTAGLLSNMTNHAALVFSPALDRSVARHVELVGLGGDRAMVVIVSDSGRVENHVVRVPEDIDDGELDRTAAILNGLVVGKPLESVAQTILGAVEGIPLEFRDAATRVGTVLESALAAHEGERVFLEGTSNMVDEHKFSDLETVRQVIGALEHRRILLELLAEGLSVDSMSVRIGSENLIEEMQHCAVITAPYGSEGVVLGTLGVVGPTRMDYRRSIAAVYEVATNLGRMLTGPSA
ncbi:MAG: heat-inducible transcription repressor HrcA [Actinobacteria bacterium]|nr:heat-inducible transcription repressor HrcA [Actinomycetota bacterium]